MGKLSGAYAAVAQLDRVFGYEPKGRGFESLQPYQLALTKKMQAKIPHFGAGFLLLKTENGESSEQYDVIYKIRKRKIKITSR